MQPFRAARDLLTSIPGFSRITAEVFVAETGADMSVFPTAGHLASWAGLSPGSNESAGRTKSTKTRPGNRYLKGALGNAALTAARSKNTYFAAKYRRIATRRGPMRAIVAVEHAMVIAAWNLLVKVGLSGLNRSATLRVNAAMVACVDASRSGSDNSVRMIAATSG
jgi:transposase